MIKKNILKKIYKQRSLKSHKYDYGNLLIIAGSKKYSGSPTLCALAALRSGVDLVTVVAPHRSANIVASFAPDIITYPLKGDYLKKRDLKEIFELEKSSSAVIIGPGLERKKETFQSIIKFLEKTNKPCVIDADAIYAISENKKVVKDKKFVITPHLHEFYVLSKKKVVNLNKSDIKKIVIQSASEMKTTIILKGNTDIISDGLNTEMNMTGNPYMTKGGTGDTLAGICGSLMAQGCSQFISACGASYINGRAGDIAAKDLKMGMLASDLIQKIPNVLNE